MHGGKGKGKRERGVAEGKNGGELCVGKAEAVLKKGETETGKGNEDRKV